MAIHKISDTTWRAMKPDLAVKRLWAQIVAYFLRKNFPDEWERGAGPPPI
jgi:hypothetical protein